VHKAGILHLDLTPANVLIGPDGEPKLADFGLAHLRAAMEYSTQTLGFTPGYSAPEFFLEAEPTAASDLYGLGATLFALLAGHAPFLRSRDEQPRNQVIFGRQLHEPVPELDRELPEDVRAVVRRAMANSPADRFGSAAEFGDALREVQRNHGLAPTPPLSVPMAQIPPQPPHPDRPPRWRLAAAGLLLLLIPAADAVHAGATPDTCARPETVQADGALSFGTLLPQTGQFVFSGPAMQAGAQLAIDDINAAGAIRGIAVKLDPANQRDEGDPSTGTASRETDALLSNGVDVIIGPGTSASAVQIINKITCAGIIMFAPATTAAMLSNYKDHGLHFRTAPSDILRKTVLANLVVADGNRTVVVMSRDDAWGNGLQQATAQAIEDAGVEVVDSFAYNPKELSYDGYVRRIQDKDPDAVIVMGFTESAQILAALINQGLGPKDKRVYGAGNMTETLTRLVNPQDPSVLTDMRGVLVNDGHDAFMQRLLEVNPGLQDLTYAAETYDAVVITALAAAAAGTDAPAAIAERINDVTKDGVSCTGYADCLKLVQEGQDIDYNGASGPLEFTDAGESGSTTYMISEFQADGSVKPFRPSRCQAIVKTVRRQHDRPQGHQAERSRSDTRRFTCAFERTNGQTSLATGLQPHPGGSACE
jgi:ABC-type branched-subunit amino acid transport system substrate-binding protein